MQALLVACLCTPPLREPLLTRTVSRGAVRAARLRPHLPPQLLHAALLGGVSSVLQRAAPCALPPAPPAFSRAQEQAGGRHAHSMRARIWGDVQARSSAQSMGAKWGDAVVQIITFDEGAVGDAALSGPGTCVACSRAAACTQACRSALPPLLPTC